MTAHAGTPAGAPTRALRRVQGVRGLLRPAVPRLGGEEIASPGYAGLAMTAHPGTPAGAPTRALRRVQGVRGLLRPAAPVSQ
ncbi:hypothetical protein [Roseiflexus castenholzii]|uniref:hypothetical protein n=1 Tax=Roseiflexus castenholzii TaxID=120962 RepID=UPI0000E7CAD7|nr:hypothetical protein [Roseiflexus castenholzii]